MTKRPRGAVAIDLGASSARYAAGWEADGRIAYEIVEQVPHHVHWHDGRECWDAEVLLGICRRALEYASAHFEAATLGIDAWGVDFGFMDGASPWVAYRDRAHQAAFDRMKEVRGELYALTGIQHQPFNTFYQLVARGEFDPSCVGRPWRMLPEQLLGALGGEPGFELTHASTTQLMGLDGRWSERAFELAGWPVPDVQPQPPGGDVGRVGTVTLVRVAEHDSASAVAGMGRLAPEEAFLSAGTWSLLGCVVDAPIVSLDAAAGNFTNERAADGRVRFLKNIPGFYIANRLHEELGGAGPAGAWLAAADMHTDLRIDPLDAAFFNPESMAGAVRERLPRTPSGPPEWAGLAILSLAEAAARELVRLEAVAGRAFTTVRVGGGGAQCVGFCESLARITGRRVQRGEVEATVLGNLRVQLGHR